MKVYKRTGDDGTTGLLFGGRVAKDSAGPMAYGEVDEAQAFIGLARAECERGSELDKLLVQLERDLWVLMAELATAPDKRDKLVGGTNLVTPAMVDALEVLIDSTAQRFEAPTEFVVPGQNRRAASLGVARAGRPAGRATFGRLRPRRLVRGAVLESALGSVVGAGAMAGRWFAPEQTRSLIRRDGSRYHPGRVRRPGRDARRSQRGTCCCAAWRCADRGGGGARRRGHRGAPQRA